MGYSKMRDLNLAGCKNEVNGIETKWHEGGDCLELAMTMYRRSSWKKDNDGLDQMGPPFRYQDAANSFQQEEKFGESCSSVSKQKLSASCPEDIPDQGNSAAQIGATSCVQGDIIDLEGGDEVISVTGLPPVVSLDSSRKYPSVSTPVSTSVSIPPLPAFCLPIWSQLRQGVHVVSRTGGNTHEIVVMTANFRRFEEKWHGKTM